MEFCALRHTSSEEKAPSRDYQRCPLSTAFEIDERKGVDNVVYHPSLEDTSSSRPTELFTGILHKRRQNASKKGSPVISELTRPFSLPQTSNGQATSFSDKPNLQRLLIRAEFLKALHHVSITSKFRRRIVYIFLYYGIPLLRIIATLVFDLTDTCPTLFYFCASFCFWMMYKLLDIRVKVDSLIVAFSVIFWLLVRILELLGPVDTVCLLTYLLLPYIVPVAVDLFGENPFGCTSELSVPVDKDASILRESSLTLKHPQNWLHGFTKRKCGKTVAVYGNETRTSRWKNENSKCEAVGGAAHTFTHYSPDERREGINGRAFGRILPNASAWCTVAFC
ncbi:unnamed protein product [Taenia asiatica]|uniref:Uncharacterized protein n=1 Tax=Taenia asiatica TaxID=60517 RepID=A0A0R3WFY3_TAEAS|nr:unnamed protein product [Taenia asiatica]